MLIFTILSSVSVAFIEECIHGGSHSAIPWLSSSGSLV